jgi:hypothetical protein
LQQVFKQSEKIVGGLMDNFHIGFYFISFENFQVIAATFPKNLAVR